MNEEQYYCHHIFAARINIILGQKKKNNIETQDEENQMKIAESIIKRDGWKKEENEIEKWKQRRLDGLQRISKKKKKIRKGKFPFWCHKRNNNNTKLWYGNGRIGKGGDGACREWYGAGFWQEKIGKNCFLLLIWSIVWIWYFLRLPFGRQKKIERMENIIDGWHENIEEQTILFNIHHNLK